MSYSPLNRDVDNQRDRSRSRSRSPVRNYDNDDYTYDRQGSTSNNGQPQYNNGYSNQQSSSSTTAATSTRIMHGIDAEQMNLPVAPGKVFVGGLNFHTTEQSIRDYFSKYGTIADVEILFDKYTNRNRGFGFVTYNDDPSAEELINDFKREPTNFVLDGRQLSLRRAVSKEAMNDIDPKLKQQYAIHTSRLFIGNTGDANEADVRNLFNEYGNIVSVEVILDKVTNAKRGFAFLTVENEEIANKILAETNGKSLMIQDKQISITKAKPKAVDGGPHRNAYPNYRGGYGGSSYGSRGGYYGSSRGGYGDSRGYNDVRRGGPYHSYDSRSRGGYDRGYSDRGYSSRPGPSYDNRSSGYSAGGGRDYDRYNDRSYDRSYSSRAAPVYDDRYPPSSAGGSRGFDNHGQPPPPRDYDRDYDRPRY